MSIILFLVSNKIAVDAMVKKAEEFNLETNIVSTELYDEVDEALEKIFTTIPDVGILQGRSPTSGISYSGSR